MLSDSLWTVMWQLGNQLGQDISPKMIADIFNKSYDKNIYVVLGDKVTDQYILINIGEEEKDDKYQLLTGNDIKFELQNIHNSYIITSMPIFNTPSSNIKIFLSPYNAANIKQAFQSSIFGKEQWKSGQNTPALNTQSE